MVQTRKCDASPCFGSTSRSGKMNCARCQKSFHLKCAGLTTNQYKFIRDCPGAVWFCLICRNTPDVDQSAANFSFHLILERISSVIRLVGRQIEVTRTLCRAFGQDAIRPSNSSIPLSSQTADDGHSRNFIEELDNLQLDFTNEFNSLVDAADPNAGNNRNRSSSPSSMLSSSNAGREGDVPVTVDAGINSSTTVPTASVPSPSTTTSCTLVPPASTDQLLPTSSGAAAIIIPPGNITQVICPTEASSDTAPPSIASHHVADNIPKLLPGVSQSKKDATTQFLQTALHPGNAAPIPAASVVTNQFASETSSVSANNPICPGNIGLGICPAGVGNGTASSHLVFHPILAPFPGNAATMQRPPTNKNRIQSTNPSVPFTSAPMPYWYLPPSASSMLYPSYVNSNVPQQVLLPSYNVPVPAAVSTNGSSTTTHAKPPAVSRQLPPVQTPNINTTTVLRPPVNSSSRNLAPTTLRGANEPVERFKHFYITPFEPSTTAEHISNYISGKTGWTKASFRCQPLATAARRGRPLSFVSFKVLILDNPAFTNVITKPGFWPSFVSVTPFKSRSRK